VVPAFVLSLILVAAFSVCGCGGYNPSGSGAPGSGLTKRAFISNDQDGTVHVLDAQNDLQSGTTIATGSRPGPMALSTSGKFTLVFNVGDLGLSVIQNSSETVTGKVTLPDVSRSFVMLSDDKTAFAAVRNAGVVEVIDFSSSTIAKTLTIPLANRLVLSHDGKTILVFSDQTDSITTIDTTAQTAGTPVAIASRPVFGVFSSDDDKKAWILSCGPECGGAQAMVTPLDMTTNPPILGASVDVAAATVAVLDGNNLYVAGTGATPGALAGKLSVLDTNNLATPASTVPISDGFHDRMELASNGRIFVGAINVCTGGCLTMFNKSAGSAVLSAPLGDVTGIAPISNRNVVYVVEGGELKIYDTTADALQPNQIDIVGKAVDVKNID
jgi:DNA-binding beta-propeller fold protein YncE